MRFFNRPRKPVDPDELRATLFGAIATRDHEKFRGTCNKYSAAILENFKSWTKLPEEFRGHPDATESWALSLKVIADEFNKAGNPQLLAILTPDRDHPLSKWPDIILRSERQREAGNCRASIEMLLQVLKEMEGMSGPAIDDTRAKVYGHLGASYSGLNKRADAIRYIALALEECLRSGDAEGVEMYSRFMRQLAASE